jgi:phage gpG-like protein
MVDLVVTVDDSGVQRTLERIAANLNDLRPVFERIADDFHSMESRLFTSRGGSASEPWAPSASGHAVTLTGQRERLKRSLTLTKVSKSVTRITRNSVTLGSTHPLAHLHQGGTGPRYARTYKGKPLAKPRYAGSLPRRVVLSVRPEDEQRWNSMLSEHVLASTGSLGL